MSRDVVVACAAAGATLVHVHVRDPATGRPNTAFDLDGEVVEPGRVPIPVTPDRARPIFGPPRAAPPG